jgi:hypothetical protein
LTAEQAAWVLNCQPHDVPILVAARLLKPLGNPAANGIKFFAVSELLEQVKDRAWLVKVTNAVNQHWQKNNASKKNHPLIFCRTVMFRQKKRGEASGRRDNRHC